MAIPANVKLEVYKYSMTDITLTADGFEEPLVIRKDFISSLIFINDYEQNIVPKIQLTCRIEKENYEKLITNTDTMNASFEIYQIFCGTQEVAKGNPEDEPIEQEHLWKSFKLKVMNANDVSTSNINKLNNSKNLDEGVPDNLQNTIDITLYLYDNEAIKKMKIAKSFILTGGKNDILYRFFKDRGVDRVLMSPSDNEFDEYVIPYGPLVDNLTLLNNYYGIYDTPHLLFKDFDCTYLIEKGKVGNTLRQNELPVVSIYLSDIESSSNTQFGSYTDIDNNMYILSTNSFSITNNDADIDYAIGGKIKTAVNGSGEILEDTIGDNDVERFVVVNNLKQHSQFIYNVNETRRNIILTFSNIDINIMTPNKKYVLLPDETIYSSDYQLQGEYRMCGSVLLFRVSNDAELTCSTQVMLRKLK